MAKATALERWWAKVEITTSCWLWKGAISSGSGYGNFWVDGKYRNAHAVGYELLVGPIPNGLEIDHLCRVRRCVNPAHLEPVTHAVNMHRGESLSGINSRKTHCKRGHLLQGQNLYVIKGREGRQCKECRKLAQREYMSRVKNKSLEEKQN